MTSVDIDCGRDEIQHPGLAFAMRMPRPRTLPESSARSGVPRHSRYGKYYPVSLLINEKASNAANQAIKVAA